MRKWHVAEALTSVRRLKAILQELTEEEVLHALSMEKQTLNRESIVSILITQAIKFYKEKLHGTYKIGRSHEGRKEDSDR